MLRARTQLAILEQSSSADIHRTIECEAGSSACNVGQAIQFNPILTNIEGYHFSQHLNQTIIREPRSILYFGLLRVIPRVL